MDFALELARFNPDPALAEWVSDTVQKLLDQTQKDAAALQHKDLKIAALTLELAHHKRIRFAHKSEAFSPEQRTLFEESWDTDSSAIEAEVEQLTPVRKPRSRAGRKPLPEHLPRLEERHEPASCTCGQCGADLVQINEDVSEQLDVEPARFFVRRHIRPQYACRACETVSAAPIPATVIDGGLAAPGLLAWVATQKFLDHLPLYRIEQISGRYGVPLARSTLAEWVGRIGVALQPLADRLAELLRERAILHADETPVAQLDPGRGKTQRAYLWAYRSNDLDTGPPLIVFDYRPSRAGEHAQNFLADWRGHLMVDDYGGYKALFRSGIVELACMAHARRKFFDLHAANHSPIAAEARLELRRQEAQPKLQALHAWLTQTRLTVADNSGAARALDYTLKRWPALIRYAESGVLPIDNNPIENAIRPIAIGKKNWLFAGKDTRRPSGGGDPKPPGHRQAQWPGTLRLAQGHARKIADLAV